MRGGAAWLAVLALAALALALPVPALAAGPGPGGSVFLGGIAVEPSNLVEGTPATVHLLLVNNGSFNLTLWNITVNDTVSGSAAVLVGSQDSVVVPAGTNVTLSFPWTPPGGVHTLAARAEVREGNATIPLPATAARVQVNKAPIVEPWTVVGAILALVGIVMAIAVVPALLERPFEAQTSNARHETPLDSGSNGRRPKP